MSCDWRIDRIWLEVEDARLETEPVANVAKYKHGGECAAPDENAGSEEDQNQRTTLDENAGDEESKKRCTAPISNSRKEPEVRCKVRLKADRAHPEPMWWPVEGSTLGMTALDTYKEILREIDKKRMVLAGLTWDCPSSCLHCDALRFQSSELGSR